MAESEYVRLKVESDQHRTELLSLNKKLSECSAELCFQQQQTELREQHSKKLAALGQELEAERLRKAAQGTTSAFTPQGDHLQVMKTMGDVVCQALGAANPAKDTLNQWNESRLNLFFTSLGIDAVAMVTHGVRTGRMLKYLDKETLVNSPFNLPTFQANMLLDAIQEL